MKKFGGTIKDWQIHNLSFTEKQIDKIYPGQKAKPIIISGTVIEDPLKRWKPGYHMTTSLVVKLDREKNTVETLNTIYKLDGEEGKDILPNLGDNILNIFY